MRGCGSNWESLAEAPALLLWWRGESESPEAVLPSAVAVGSSRLKPIGRSIGGGLDVTLGKAYRKELYSSPGTTESPRRVHVRIGLFGLFLGCFVNSQTRSRMLLHFLPISINLMGNDTSPGHFFFLSFFFKIPRFVLPLLT